MMPYFFSFDGTRLYFEDYGSEKKENLLILNGLSWDVRVWRPYIERLKKEFRVIIFDYRCHGRSDPPQNCANLEVKHHAKDAMMLLEQLGVKKVSTLGYSMGVQVSLEIFRRRPELFKKMIFCTGTFGRPLDNFMNTNIFTYLYPIFYSIVHFIPEAPLNFLWKKIFNSVLPYEFAKLFIIDGKRVKASEFTELFSKTVANIPPKCYFELINFLNFHNGIHTLSYIDRAGIDVLIISGTRDNFTPPRVGSFMHKMIKGSRFVEIKGGTHTTIIEYKDEVLRLILQFLKKER